MGMVGCTLYYRQYTHPTSCNYVVVLTVVLTFSGVSINYGQLPNSPWESTCCMPLVVPLSYGKDNHVSYEGNMLNIYLTCLKSTYFLLHITIRTLL